MNVGFMRFMREINTFLRKTSIAFVGNEAFFKKEAMFAYKALIRRAQDVEEEYIDGADTKVARLDEILNESPMIGKYRVVIVDGPEKIKNIKKIAYWLTDPAMDVKVLFIYTDVDKDPPVGFEFEVVVICNDMGPDSKEFGKYVEFCLEGTNKKMSEACEVFVRKYFANNAHLLRNELVKAAYYVGDRRVIEAEDLEKTVAVYPMAKVFDLVDNVIRRDLRGALLTSNDLLDQGVEGSFLVYLITQRIITILMVSKALARGDKLKDYMIRKRIPLFQLAQILTGVRTLREPTINRFFDVLCRSEANMRSGRDMGLAVQSMVMELCQ